MHRATCASDFWRLGTEPLAAAVEPESLSALSSVCRFFWALREGADDGAEDAAPLPLPAAIGTGSQSGIRKRRWPATRSAICTEMAAAGPVRAAHIIATLLKHLTTHKHTWVRAHMHTRSAKRVVQRCKKPIAHKHHRSSTAGLSLAPDAHNM